MPTSANSAIWNDRRNGTNALGKLNSAPGGERSGGADPVHGDVLCNVHGNGIPNGTGNPRGIPREWE